jgi:hypothetical protein
MSSQTSSAVEAGNVASSDSTSSKPAESAEASTGTEPHSAHEAVNALDRFMERVSNDFMSEGKALVEAMRAEVAKLV